MYYVLECYPINLWLLCILFLLEVIRHVILTVTVTVTVTNSNQFTTMKTSSLDGSYDPNDKLNKLLVTLRWSSKVIVSEFQLCADSTGVDSVDRSGPGPWWLRLVTRIPVYITVISWHTLPLTSWHTYTRHPTYDLYWHWHGSLPQIFNGDHTKSDPIKSNFKQKTYRKEIFSIIRST